MYLNELLNGVTYQLIGQGNPNVQSLSCDTSTVTNGCMFFCLSGKKTDGHIFFRKVVADGCAVLVCEHRLDTKALQVVVSDTRMAMAQIAKNFYECCADKLKIISVVGTNGKTSTSYILESILTKAGYNTAVIGTNGIFFNGRRHEVSLTTPDPIYLHYWFRQMYLNKVHIVVMEVSAHAIALHKLCGVMSEIAVFTNFSQDHLDFFGTMENYAHTKLGFFTTQYVKNAVVNVDDSMGRKIAEKFSNVATYSVCDSEKTSAEKVNGISAKDIANEMYESTVLKKQPTVDCRAENVICGACGTIFDVEIFGQRATVKSGLSGKFNVYNILSALTCAAALNVDIDTAVVAVSEILYISGRNETVLRKDGARIVVDFAHTPDGIENILGYLKATSKGKLIVVFGCGGNRDKLKRPLMAEKVSAFADFALLTNDNPRFEDPRMIAQDAASRLSCPYRIILNRAQATEFAISMAEGNDTVAILGKGAEAYQEIRGKKIPYSDIDIVKQYCAKNMK